MNQELSSSLFYASEATAPEEITGFSPRFASLSAENASNILNVASTGGADAPASFWLVVWGPTTCHGIYPKGSTAGLSYTDKGQVTIEDIDGNGGRMEAYRSHYKWDAGLSVRDWRYVVRAQYDQGELVKNAASGADLIDLMTQALELIPNISMGRPAFYLNRTARSFLRRQVVNKVASSTLTMEEVTGRKVVTMDGVPVRRVDSLLLGTETRVS
jgi:hypothetical protein